MTLSMYWGHWKKSWKKGIYDTWVAYFVCFPSKIPIIQKSKKRFHVPKLKKIFRELIGSLPLLLLSLSIRSQDEDTQSSPCRPESNPEVACVYDNELVEEMRPTRAQQPQNNATALQREGETQPLAKVQWMWLMKKLCCVPQQTITSFMHKTCEGCYNWCYGWFCLYTLSIIFKSHIWVVFFFYRSNTEKYKTYTSHRVCMATWITI